MYRFYRPTSKLTCLWNNAKLYLHVNQGTVQWCPGFLQHFKNNNSCAWHDVDLVSSNNTITNLKLGLNTLLIGPLWIVIGIILKYSTSLLFRTLSVLLESSLSWLILLMYLGFIAKQVLCLFVLAGFHSWNGTNKYYQQSWMWIKFIGGCWLLNNQIWKCLKRVCNTHRQE